jgi:hypothetical protein
MKSLVCISSLPYSSINFQPSIFFSADSIHWRVEEPGDHTVRHYPFLPFDAFMVLHLLHSFLNSIPRHLAICIHSFKSLNRREKAPLAAQ